ALCPLLISSAIADKNMLSSVGRFSDSDGSQFVRQSRQPLPVLEQLLLEVFDNLLYPLPVHRIGRENSLSLDVSKGLLRDIDLLLQFLLLGSHNLPQMRSSLY